MAKLVSKVYGEALFEVVAEKKKTDIILKEAGDILSALEQNPQLDMFMKHPGISLQEKEQVLNKIFEGRVSKELTDFMKLLLHKERYGELRKILKDLIARIKEEKKIGVAFVTTAVSLSNKKRKLLEKCLLQSTDYESVEIHYQVDEAIIGGMIIRMKDRVVDSSVRTRLEEMKKQLLQIRLG